MKRASTGLSAPKVRLPISVWPFNRSRRYSFFKMGGNPYAEVAERQHGKGSGTISIHNLFTSRHTLGGGKRPGASKVIAGVLWRVLLGHIA
jgi:hypothetical protein